MGDLFMYILNIIILLSILIYLFFYSFGYILKISRKEI